jgi:hypothetical protein
LASGFVVIKQKALHSGSGVQGNVFGGYQEVNA